MRWWNPELGPALSGRSVPESHVHWGSHGSLSHCETSMTLSRSKTFAGRSPKVMSVTGPAMKPGSFVSAAVRSSTPGPTGGSMTPSEEWQGSM